jgi:hypothetical protein
MIFITLYFYKNYLVLLLYQYRLDAFELTHSDDNIMTQFQLHSILILILEALR